MILIDIGNTALHIGIEKKNTIVKAFRLASHNLTAKKFQAAITPFGPQPILVCSVAPSVTKIITKTRQTCYIVGKDIPVPIRCRYKKNEVGQDRLVNAYAAKMHYPAARMIIDFGTAITVDILSRRSEYEGGFILPGITLYLSALARCELLPRHIMLKKSRARIPKNTQDSISKGVEEGFSLMINAFVHKYARHLFKRKTPAGIIVTGGESTLLRKTLSFDFIHAPLLTLKGLLALKGRYGL